MDPNILKYMAFAQTVEQGSFTKAAEKLNYSQSGVSRMVADLEADWQVSLLERHKGGVSLTPDGARILPFVRNLCEEFDNLAVAVDELQGLHSGVVRIATFSSGATQWLPNIIRDFHEAYPNVTFEIMQGDYTDIEQWILDGEADCWFLPLPVHPSLNTVFLEHNQMMAVLPPQHRLASKTTVSLAELTHEPFMIMAKGNGAEVENVFEGHGLKPQVAFKAWDDYAIMAMVEKGLGVSILTEMILRRCPYDVVTKPLAEPVFRDIVLAYRSKGASSLALQRFLEFLPRRA